MSRNVARLGFLLEMLQCNPHQWGGGRGWACAEGSRHHVDAEDCAGTTIVLLEPESTDCGKVCHCPLPVGFHPVSFINEVGHPHHHQQWDCVWEGKARKAWMNVPCPSLTPWASTRCGVVAVTYSG